MLDILRQHASSWMTKAILGLIILTFVISFGTTALRKAGALKGGSSDTIATVEGEELDAQMVRGRIKLARDNNPMLQNLPPEFQSQLQNMVVNEMVNEVLAKKQALKQGLRVSDEELANFIRNDPNLKNKEGKFDEEFYMQKLRPGYLTNYNIDFESWMKDRLLTHKLMSLYAGPLFVADPLLKLAFSASHTKLTLKKITLDPSNFATDFKPDPEAVKKEVQKLIAAEASPENTPDEKAVTAQVTAQMKTEAGLKEARALADKIWGDFKAGKSVASEVEKFKAKEETLPATAASELGQLIPGSDPATVSSLLGLTDSNPTPDKPIEKNGVIHLVRLVSREAPSWDAFEKEKGQEQTKLTDQLAGEFYDAWFSQVTEKAHIDINNREP